MDVASANFFAKTVVFVAISIDDEEADGAVELEGTIFCFFGFGPDADLSFRFLA